MRLFIAATFPADVIRQVDERISRVKSKLPSAAWVRPESQHLTFAFLGEQAETIVAKLEPVVKRVVGSVPSFEASVATCGFFPNPRHARVGWIGVCPDENFRTVADAVRRAVEEVGIKLDRADFRPHLTLCRIRNPWPPACITTFQQALSDYASEPFAVDRITLFSSQLHPSGAIHTPVHAFPLQNGPATRESRLA